MTLSADGATLYIADTGNHAIRAVALATGEVSTVAGTGSQAPWPPTAGIAPQVALNSPWDLTLDGDVLYIAMAGTHQIWTLDLETGLTAPFVGNGRESTVNGTLATAELAQPSSVEFDDAGRLLFADSESSSIRYADIGANLTGVLAGSDANLFDFGLVDGVGTEARFQHPLGVAVWSSTEGGDGTIFIADTYNSAIRTIDPVTGETQTYAGGQRGWADGTSPLFYEPGGVDIDGSTLYVADTNNHVVRIIDLATGTAETLVLKGIERFAPPPDDEDYRGVIVETGAVISPGAGTFALEIELPAGYKVNEEAPSSVTWTVNGDAARLAGDADRSLTGVTFPVEIGATFESGSASVVADLNVVYCEATTPDLCLIQQIRFVTALTVSEDAGATTVPLAYSVVLPPGAGG
ncbi:MAG: hypothetical protein HKN01_06500 [Acidimicrobiia bacterium]|nr:hypothetical protein [Acidimicrobiia bacterium]